MQKKNLDQPDFSKNLKLYYFAVCIIVFGYIVLSIGGAESVTSLTLGPIILVIGYLIAIPVALLTGVGNIPKKTAGEDADRK